MDTDSPYVIAYRSRYRKKSPVPTNYETIKDSVKAVGKEYCSESSICGLKHLVNDNTTQIERIIWVIILISALVCSVSLVWVTFSKYYKAPLVTTQMPEGVSVRSIIFPAVGICSNNRISKRAASELADRLLEEKRNKKYNKKEMMTLLFGLGQLYNLQQVMSDNDVRTKQLHEALGDYDVTELMRNLTPSCDNLLMRCMWNEKPENCSHLFNFRLTMNGFCCTFNYLRQSDIFEENSGSRSIDMYKYGNKSAYDFDLGLKVLVKMDTDDDFYYNIPSLGSTLQFSDAYDFPDAPSGSYAMQIISPSVQMTVTVSATFTEASRDIQHVSVKLRSCLFYDESSYLPFYTHSDCMLKCRMLFLLENCNCTPFNMPKINNGRTCDMRDIPCLRIFYAQSITVRPDVDPIAPELELDMVRGGIPCPMCYPTCSKTAYSYDFNNLAIYPDNLNNVPDEDRDDWLIGTICAPLILNSYWKTTGRIPHAPNAIPSLFYRVGANYTGTSIIHVKYAKGVADCFGQNVIMKWFDLISNIGSTCGFVTGFSFVSVLEFFYFFTVKLFREMSARRRVRDVTATPAHLKPIPRYRSIYWNELGNSAMHNYDSK